jgi:hypothetical protein
MTEKKTTPPANDLATAVAAALAAVGLGGGDSGKTVSSESIKLTTASAKQLLQTIADDIQFTGKFTPADIAAFVASYNKMANEQLDTVIREARETTQSGKTGDIASTVKNIITTKYPSFFDPKTFTRDFIWSKVNFKDEKTLGAKALDALTTARGIAKAYNLSTVSEVEIQDAAKKIASGKLSADDYKTQLASKASIEYPQYGERLKTTPGATIRDLVNPVLRVIADSWEVDVNSLDLNDPFIDKLIRPDGTVGKISPASIGEAKRAADAHPNRDKTVAENNNARNAATDLASALGFGV